MMTYKKKNKLYDYMFELSDEKYCTHEQLSNAIFRAFNRYLTDNKLTEQISQARDDIRLLLDYTFRSNLINGS